MDARGHWIGFRGSLDNFFQKLSLLPIIKSLIFKVYSYFHKRFHQRSQCLLKILAQCAFFLYLHFHLLSLFCYLLEFQMFIVVIDCLPSGSGASPVNCPARVVCVCVCPPTFSSGNK